VPPGDVVLFFDQSQTLDQMLVLVVCWGLKIELKLPLTFDIIDTRRSFL
jgi:hypothetical protein